MPAPSTTTADPGARLTTMLREAERRLGLSPDPADPGKDDGDRAHAYLDREIDGAARERLGETVRRVRAALDALTAGDYGRCLDCGFPIEAKRLAVLPEAERCRECQGSFERAAENAAVREEGE